MSELITVTELTPIIFANGKIDEIMMEIKTKAESFKGDVATDAGRKEIASFAYKIARSKTALDEVGKEFISREKEKISIVDAKRKAIRDTCDYLKDIVRQPLTDFEEAEKLRVENYKKRLALIVEAGNSSEKNWQMLSVVEMNDMLQEVASERDFEWEEYLVEAEKLILDAVDKIDEAIRKRLAYDKQQTELEQLRKEKAEREKLEYEEKLKADAIEKATIQTENARKAAEVAQQKAEADLKAEQEKSKREAEEAVLRERARVEANNAAIKKEEEARAKDLQHKKKIHNEIKEALFNISGDNVTLDEAQAIVIALVKGKIPHLKVTY